MQMKDSMLISFSCSLVGAGKQFCSYRDLYKLLDMVAYGAAPLDRPGAHGCGDEGPQGNLRNADSRAPLRGCGSRGLGGWPRHLDMSS